ncbi:hypothetical protein AQZ49_14370 [Novosphingobium sp. FSW06-99]|nr:hypothetical protein AQZ49_14370 [Novosphingobium sp. FSW06-99]
MKVSDVQDAVAIHSNIWTMTQATAKGGAKELTKTGGYEDQCFVPVGKKPGGYKRAWRIILKSVPNSKFWPHLSYTYVDHMASSLRIDFVPHDIGAQGLFELHSILSMIVPNGWDYFVCNGHITRIDISVDLPTLTMKNLHLLPKQAATTKVWRSNGQLETFQHGKTKGNHTVIYDRTAKRKAKGTMAPDKVGVRIERRLAKTSILLKHLDMLPCPYDDFSMVKRVPGPPAGGIKPYVWTLLLNSAEHIGLPAALALLPEDARTVARKHLTQHIVAWWNVEVMWDSWQHMLGDLKLADTTAWA